MLKRLTSSKFLNSFKSMDRCLHSSVQYVYCSTGHSTSSTEMGAVLLQEFGERNVASYSCCLSTPYHTRKLYWNASKIKTTNCPDLPPIDQNDWNVGGGVCVPVICINLPSHRAVIELTKYGCKSGCKGRFSCTKNDLSCTPLCKCYTSDCANVIKDNVHKDDVNESLFSINCIILLWILSDTYLICWILFQTYLFFIQRGVEGLDKMHGHFTNIL